MKYRMIALLLTVCLVSTLLPVPGVWAEEEMELFFSENELVQDKSEESGEQDPMEELKDMNAAIMEALGKKDWEELAAKVKLSGDWRDDLVNVAESQIGYQEEKDGMTLYTRWAGMTEAADWSALFVNWVAAQIGLNSKEFPQGATYEGLRSGMSSVKAVKGISRSTYPTAGDLALIETNGQQLVGIVVYVSNDYASVIHGDDNGRVTKETYYVGGAEFKHYVDLNVLMERAGIEVGKGGAVPEIPEGGVAAWTNTNAVYMRSEPTTASKSLTTIKKARTALLVTSAEMQADGYIWYGVEYQKYTGYIRGDLVELDLAAIPTATPAPTKKPEATAVPGCVYCAGVANGVALPMECCYEHLKALGAEYAAPFMSALKEADETMWDVYTKCHAAHVDAGEAAIIPMNGLTMQERVVNIDVKKALVGEAVTIGFEIYGANYYEWHEVQYGEDEDGQSTEMYDIVISEGKTAAELTVYVKPDASYSYYCKAFLPMAGGNSVEMISKRTRLTAGAPIVAVAILGEEVNFTYEYVGAESYRWYKVAINAPVVENVQSEADNTADTARFTTFATSNSEGVYYYCDALDADGNVISTSGYYTYTIDTTNMSKYVDELVGMTRAERHSTLTEAWDVTVSNGYEAFSLNDAVVEYWETECQSDYPSLLCTCGMKPVNAIHDDSCGWYVKTTSDDKNRVYRVDATYGSNFPHQCEIKLADNYALYYENVLLKSDSSPVLYFAADDTERVYKCVVTKGSDIYTLTYIVTAYELEADRVQNGYDLILDKYIAMIIEFYADKDSDQNPTGVYNRYPIYELMTGSWNKEVMDYSTNQKVNLAKALLSYWNGMNHFFGEDTIFCTCCIKDGVVSDKIMLHPDAIHTNTQCPWNPFSPDNTAKNEATGIVVNGILPDDLTLNAKAGTPDHDVFAKMWDAGEYALVALKAYDITPVDKDEKPWQPAKGTTVMVTIPDVYDPDSVQAPVVNVYHLLVDDLNDIVPGYGYTKLSSEYYNGVNLNGDGSITFETDWFSTFYIEVSSPYDKCHICEGVDCVYSDMISLPDARARYEDLQGKNGTLKTLLAGYYNHVQAGALDVLCKKIRDDFEAGEDITLHAPGADHDGDCPWHQNVYFYTDEYLLVGDKVTLNSKQTGASYAWYCEGEIEPFSHEVSVEVEATAHKVTYTCVIDGYHETHVVAAQTSVLYYYISRIYNVCMDSYTGALDKDAIYTLMTGKWNVVANANQKAEPMNLAQAILAYWDQTGRYGMDAGLFCSCCFTHDGNGIYTFTGIMRRPNDLHKDDCDWVGTVTADPDVSSPDALKGLPWGTTIELSTTLKGNNIAWQQGTINANGTITWDEQNSIASGKSCVITLSGEALTKVYRCVDNTGAQSTIAYIGGIEFSTWASSAEVLTWLTNLPNGNENTLAIILEHILEAYAKHLHGIPLSEVICMDGGKLYELLGGTLLAELDENNQLIDTRYHIAVAKYDPATGVITALN